MTPPSEGARSPCPSGKVYRANITERRAALDTELPLITGDLRDGQTQGVGGAV